MAGKAALRHEHARGRGQRQQRAKGDEDLADQRCLVPGRIVVAERPALAVATGLVAARATVVCEGVADFLQRRVASLSWSAATICMVTAPCASAGWSASASAFARAGHGAAVSSRQVGPQLRIGVGDGRRARWARRPRRLQLGAFCLRKTFALCGSTCGWDTALPVARLASNLFGRAGILSGLRSAASSKPPWSSSRPPRTQAAPWLQSTPCARRL